MDEIIKEFEKYPVLMLLPPAILLYAYLKAVYLPSAQIHD